MFNSFWSINSPRKTAVGIVLDVSENSHGNVYIEVLSSCSLPTWGLLFLPDWSFCQIFRKQKRVLEVIYKSSCSALVNAVMKYLNFHRSGLKLERELHSILLKVALHHSQIWQTAIWKNALLWLLLMATLFWETSWMAASKRQLQNIYLS